MNHEDTRTPRPIPKATDLVARQVVDAAFAVHSTLGPGLIESVYEQCLCHELAERGLDFKRQLSLPVLYKGVRLDGGLRLDLLVADQVIVELKTVEAITGVHKAQLLTYLKLTECRLGLLINFNVPRIRDGIVRLAL